MLIIWLHREKFAECDAGGPRLDGEHAGWQVHLVWMQTSCGGVSEGQKEDPGAVQTQKLQTLLRGNSGKKNYLPYNHDQI